MPINNIIRLKKVRYDSATKAKNALNRAIFSASVNAFDKTNKNNKKRIAEYKKANLSAGKKFEKESSYSYRLNKNNASTLIGALGQTVRKKNSSNTAKVLTQGVNSAPYFNSAIGLVNGSNSISGISPGSGISKGSGYNPYKDLYYLQEQANALNVAMNRENNRFNANQAQLQRNWETQMSNTAHQREVADLQASGLNPILSANGGATVPTGGTASNANFNGADTTLISALSSILASTLSANATMTASAINAQAQRDTANISALASRDVAQSNLFGTMYGADLGYDAKIYQSDLSYKANKYDIDMRRGDNYIKAGSNILAGLLGIAGTRMPLGSISKIGF